MINRRTSVFYAGLAFGVALFGVRMTTADTFRDVLFAAALTLAEFSVLWLWEKRAQQLGHDLAAWTAEEISRGRLYEQSRAADDNLDDRQKEVDQNQEETQALERECELDHVLSDQKALIAIATNAIRGGYHAGIAENNGAVNGGGDLGPDGGTPDASRPGGEEPRQNNDEEEEDGHAK